MLWMRASYWKEAGCNLSWISISAGRFHVVQKPPNRVMDSQPVGIYGICP
jgi:hypothetical protein